LLSCGKAAHVMIARMVAAIAKINAVRSCFGAIVLLLAPISPEREGG